jgi:nucleoside-diphosphate-sugar epimerase
MKFLVTGGAGFIGSNLTEYLLDKGYEVAVLDDLSSGKMENIDQFLPNPKFKFIRDTVTDPSACRKACEGADYVFHEAALCSVPRSIDDPETTEKSNVLGTSNVFLAARDAGVKRVVWASSTSVYGNTDVLPNVEDTPLAPLSPYAASKAAGEMFARAYSEVYDISIISLRYFNVFGKCQDPFSFYAAVIPIFVSKLLKGERPVVYGDGEQTRDFVHIDDVVQANVKAALDAGDESSGKAFNIGRGEETSVNDLYRMIASEMGAGIEPEYAPPRSGEIRKSVADISAAKKAFGYFPKVSVREGIKKSLGWYSKNLV